MCIEADFHPHTEFTTPQKAALGGPFHRLSRRHRSPIESACELPRYRPFTPGGTAVSSQQLSEELDGLAIEPSPLCLGFCIGIVDVTATQEFIR